MAKEKQQKRSRFETINTILKLCIKGTKKTHIMYRANLSHQQLEKYLSLLLERSLIAAEDGGYATTPRGMNFIEKFNELQGIMNEVNGQLRIRAQGPVEPRKPSL